MADKRESNALNIFYGNRTVAQTLEQKWAKYQAYHGYFYGDGTEVLFSALGYNDFEILSHRLYTEFEVAISHTLAPSAPIRNMQDFLAKWLHFPVRNLGNERFTKSDALVLVDIENSPRLREIRYFANAVIQAGGKVFVVSGVGTRVPIEICSLDRTVGVQTALSMPFLVSAFDQSLSWFQPGRIFVVGESKRVITTAMSAYDHLLFHQYGKANKIQAASRIVVHDGCNSLNIVTNSFEDVCNELGIPATNNVLPNAKFGNANDAVYLTAIQQT